MKSTLLLLWALSTPALAEICNPLLHGKIDPIPLIDAIATLNQEVAEQKLSLASFTSDGFLSWYNSLRLFRYPKEQRTYLDSFLAQGQLPPGTSFQIDSQTWIKPRINFRLDFASTPFSTDQETIIQGNQYLSWDVRNLAELEQEPGFLSEELFRGTPLSPSESGHFPKTVPIQIREVQIEFQTFKELALDIRFQIRADNLEALAHYFGTSYSEKETLNQLTLLLGNNSDRWISIKDLLQGWPAQWINRFPAEKTQVDHLIFNGQEMNANDVCHGVARQFFQNELSNKRGGDRSTEATEFLLKTKYVCLSDGVEPSFGDYLYLPGIHSIRFILKDPVSNRWIGFSAWSSSNTPYRLWWVDQDYTFPGGLTGPQPKADFPLKFDIWRKHQ